MINIIDVIHSESLWSPLLHSLTL